MSAPTATAHPAAGVAGAAPARHRRVGANDIPGQARARPLHPLHDPATPSGLAGAASRHPSDRSSRRNCPSAWRSSNRRRRQRRAMNCCTATGTDWRSWSYRNQRSRRGRASPPAKRRRSSWPIPRCCGSKRRSRSRGGVDLGTTGDRLSVARSRCAGAWLVHRRSAPGRRGADRRPGHDAISRAGETEEEHGTAAHATADPTTCDWRGSGCRPPDEAERGRRCGTHGHLLLAEGTGRLR